MHPSTLLAAAAALVAASLAPLASAHGYLSSPPPRGASKATYSVDSLKSPNAKGLCRGEPEGEKTHVKAGQSLRLGLTITAPHKGPCRVTLLDADLTNEQPVAEKMDCAAPGGPGEWTIQLPKGVRGHKVLRWYWEGRHVSPAEPYEQCVDLVFDGEGSYEGDAQGEAKAPEQPRYDADEEGERKPTHSHAAQPKYEDTPKYEDSQDKDNDDKPKYEAAKPKHKPRKPNKASKKNDTYSDDRDSGAEYSGDEAGEGACRDGAYRCASASGGRGFLQCAHGEWVRMQCATGTVCRPSGQSIACA